MSIGEGSRKRENFHELQLFLQPRGACIRGGYLFICKNHKRGAVSNVAD
jgi:hypothetical protein